MADYTRPINTEVTFTATDDTLTSHTWKVDNVIKSTINPFIYFFDEVGIFTVRHEGSSPNGSCVPIEKTIEITEEEPEPEPEPELGMGTAFIVGAGLGIAYLLMKKK